ncbi:C25 family cysteine peptidase [Calditrichota bacterium LG25]
MKYSILILLTAFSLLIGQSVEIRHSYFNVEITQEGAYHHINYKGVLNGAPLKNDDGNPELPFYVKRILLEPGQEIASFSINKVETAALDGDFNVFPKQPLWSSEQNLAFLPPNPTVYNSEEPFPARVVEYLGTQFFHGRSIAHFAIYPFQYRPAQQKLIFIQQINFTYTTRATEKSFVQPAIAQDANVVDKLLNDSPTNLLAAKFSLPASTDQIDLDLLSSGLIDRYVIITTDSLASAFEPLAEWKTQRGVPAVIRTISWIRENFPDGLDDAERMRSFIRWTYAKRGTRYVLLGGDTEIVPTRFIHTGNFTFPTDYYFADLDGTWNGDQDDTFGEAKDAVEGYPEVYVARIPVLTTKEVTLFVKKLFEYEKLENIDAETFPASILYLAGDLQRENDSRDQLILKHIDPLIPAEFQRTMISQSEHTGSRPDVPLRELNKSYGLIFSEGHGLYFTYRPGARGSDLYNYHLNELRTPDPAIWYMASCYTNDISKRCFGEDYLLSPNGGGVAYIGNSSWEYPFSGIYLQKEFFNLIFYEGFYHLSEAHYLSRLPYLGYLNYEGPSRIIVYSTIVLGDPEMPVWTAKTRTFNLSDSLMVTQAERYLQVTLTRNDSTNLPVANALIVLYKKDALYKMARTDNMGVARLDLNGVVLDSVTLTAWARNYQPQQKTIDLRANEPYAFKLQDPAFELVNGNNNNQCEPGETFRLRLNLKNTGRYPWLVNTRIHINERGNLCQLSDTLQILKSAVQPGDTLKTQPVELQIASGIQTDTTVFMEIAVEPVRGKKMTVVLPFNIYVPRLKIHKLMFSTLADSGEFNTSMVSLELFNQGKGKAWQISGRITAADSLAQIEEDRFYLDGLAPNSAHLVEHAFVVKHKAALTLASFNLMLSDASGNTWRQKLDFNPPHKVESVSFRPAAADGILLSWPAAPDSDVAGYLIYRSAAKNGPFELVTPTPVLNAGYFVDHTTDPASNYFYTIQVVDSSGNYSAFSDTIQTWSALPFQAGFPVRPSVRAIGSEVNGVVAYDLNGDRHKELIVSGGNGQLHVYDWQGSLLFSVEGLEGDLTVPAIGQVTGDAQVEIVVAGSKEGLTLNNVYVIDSQNGQLLASANLHYNVPSSAVLADLDADGYDEILLLTHGNNAPEPPQNSRVFIFTDSSGVLTGFKDWPDDGYALVGSASVGNLATADLDQSGQLSVVVPTVESKLYCFKPDSAVQPRWIKTMPNPLEAPVSLADIDLDGFIEIIVPVIKSDRLFVLKHDGSEYAGWENGQPCNVTNPYWHVSPAIVGNVDEDPELEIVYVGRDAIYLYEHDGRLKADFPIAINNGDDFFDNNWEVLPPYNSPILADVNQDGAQDIIYLDAYGYIHAFSSLSGQEVGGFPLYIKNSFIKGQSPVIDDLDGDGDLDILMANHEGVLLVWDAPQKYDETTTLLWNQPFANVQHSGLYTPLRLEIISGLADEKPNIPQEFFLKPNYPNPFNPQTAIVFGLRQTAQIRLTIYNILGQKIAELGQDQSFGPGVHKLTWNGKNALQQEMASGIYFYRLTVRDPASGKILFTKVNKMIKLK